MADSKIDLTIDGDEPDFDPESGFSSNESRPKPKQTRERESVNKKIKEITDITSKNELKKFKGLMKDVQEQMKEALEAEFAPIESALASYGITKQKRSGLKRQFSRIRAKGGDSESAMKASGLPLDEIAESASMSVQGYEGLLGDTERAFSQEDIFKAIAEGKPKAPGVESEEVIRDAFERYRVEREKIFDSIKEQLTRKRKENEKALDALYEQMDIDERKAIQEEAFFTQNMEAGGGSKEPPLPPPAPPSFPDDDDPFGKGEDPDDLEKQRRREEAAEARQQRKELQDLKAQQRRKLAEEKAIRGDEFKRRRGAIRRESQTAREQIRETTEQDTSDRIVRRLAAFDIGRAAFGGAGSLFAALTEQFVFRPEEARAEAFRKEQESLIRQREGEQLAQLEEDIFSSSLDEKRQAGGVDDLFRQANLNLANAEDNEKGRKILDALEGSLNQRSGGPSGRAGRAARVAGAGPSSLPGTGGGTGGGAFIAGGAAAGGAGGGGVSNFANASKALTSGMLGAAAATVGLQVATEVAVENLKKFGAVITADQTKPSSAASIALGGELTGKGAKVVGTGVGALIGSAFGPVGAFIGAGLGSASSSFVVEPIVTAIGITNQLMERWTDQSLGPQTIAANAQQEIQNLLTKIQNDFKVDDITADFAKTRGELSRALMDLQSEIIEKVGPAITKVVELLTVVAENGGRFIENAAASTQATIDIGKFLSGNPLLQAEVVYRWLSATDDIADNTKGVKDAFDEMMANTDLETEITGFFGDQSQFKRGPRGQFQFGNRFF